jgi:Cytochrome C biogenesis protein
MTRLIKTFVIVTVLMATLARTALAVTPDEMLKDPALEARAREVSQLLRCVVCQNQSIDDSNAPLAQDYAFWSASVWWLAIPTAKRLTFLWRVMATSFC